MCACDVFDNPEGFSEYLLDIPWVLMCYNLPASLSTLQGIGDPLPYPYVFQWTLVCIPPGCPLNLRGGFFLNRREPSMALKVILVLHYIYGNTSPEGVPYTPGY